MTGIQTLNRNDEYKASISRGEYNRWLELFPSEYETIFKDSVIYYLTDEDKANEIMDEFRELYEDKLRFISVFMTTLTIKGYKMRNQAIPNNDAFNYLQINPQDYD